MKKIDWPKCQICGEAVTTENGILTINRDDINKFKNALAEYELRYAIEREIPPTLKEIHWLDYPEEAQWHWGHFDCIKESYYSIPYDRFDTIEKALSWTLHLMENHSWLDCTNWAEAVRAHHKVSHA